jgi:hydrogenase expression/formation protein HypC
MCLAIPAVVVALHDGGMATVSLGGVRKRISLALVEGVAEGDYVLVHTGFALSRIDTAEAAKTLALLRDGGAPTPEKAPSARVSR